MKEVGVGADGVVDRRCVRRRRGALMVRSARQPPDVSATGSTPGVVPSGRTASKGSPRSPVLYIMSIIGVLNRGARPHSTASWRRTRILRVLASIGPRHGSCSRGPRSPSWTAAPTIDPAVPARWTSRSRPSTCTRRTGVPERALHSRVLVIGAPVSECCAVSLQFCACFVATCGENPPATRPDVPGADTLAVAEPNSRRQILASRGGHPWDDGTV